MLVIKFNLAANENITVGDVTLTHAQSRVAAKLVEGLSNQEIVSELGVVPSTVRYNIFQASSKLGIYKNRTSLAASISSAYSECIAVYQSNDGEMKKINSYEQLMQGLRPKQRQILDLIAKGMPAKAISQEILKSEATVKHHLSIVYNKLDNNRTAIVVAINAFRAKEERQMGAYVGSKLWEQLAQSQPNSLSKPQPVL